MITLENVEELINLEIHRAHIALGRRLVNKAKVHMDNARALELKRVLLQGR